MTELNKKLLDEDPESQAIDADEDAYYTPEPDKDSAVVIQEPKIITVGRKKRKDALRNMSNKPQ